MEAGYEVSWLPSYGPEMRSGTSNCHVRLSNEPISSPLISRPNVLLALNEPSLRKFLPEVEPGGIVLYNSVTLPEDCVRSGADVGGRHTSEQQRVEAVGVDHLLARRPFENGESPVLDRKSVV